MVGYVYELSEAIQADAIDDKTLTTVAQNASMEVLGPVPEGYT